MVKDGLGEGLSTGSLPQVGVETERLGNGQVRLCGSVRGGQRRQGTRLDFCYSLRVYMGVPIRCSAEKTCPRRTFIHDYKAAPKANIEKE